MKRLTKRAALELCIELWDWQAKNPGKSKRDWPSWGPEDRNGEKTYGEYGEIFASCFACAYAEDAMRRHERKKGMCSYCPMKWREGYCMRVNGEYELWMNWKFDHGLSSEKSDLEEGARLAKAIADVARKSLSKMKKKVKP